MADQIVSSPFPPYEFPFLDDNGRISEVWREFLLTLFRRTGGAAGFDAAALLLLISALQALVRQIDGEQAAAVPVEFRRFDFLFEPIGVSRRPADHDLGALLTQRRPIDPSDARVFAHGIQHQEDLHAVATATAAGFMSASDKTKLDTLQGALLPVQSLVSDVVAGNSAADFVVLSEIVAANTAKVGQQRRFSMQALVSNGTNPGMLQIWVKIGTVKVFMHVFTTPATAASNRGLFVAFEWCFRSIGASGTIEVAGTLFTNSTPSPTLTPDAMTAPAAIDTTVAQTFSIGFNWIAADAANTVTAKLASLTEVV